MQAAAFQQKSKLVRRLLWLMIVLLTPASLALAIIPAWIVQPFKRETMEGLTRAYTLKSWSPVLTLICAVLVFASVILLWRGARRWWLKAPLVVALLLTVVGAWFARQNHFQWMFHPINNVAYANVSEAGFVEDNDKILAVEVNGEAVAYPVRQLAYHHVVNDVIGGLPIVATY